MLSLQEIEREAKRLRVPLRNATPSDDWFIDNVAYGLAQEIRASELRLEALRALHKLVAEHHQAKWGGGE